MWRAKLRCRRFLAGAAVAAGCLAVVLVTLHAAEPSWTPVGNMASARAAFEAASLPDGRVLVAGGVAFGSIVDGAEVFDPMSNSWSTVAPLPTALFFHAMAALADGRILVAGGIPNGGSYTAAASIYDPTADNWTAASPMTTERTFCKAITLDDGRVLVVGGYGPGGYPLSAEVYDPNSNTWSLTGPLNTARYASAAVKLRDGKVLVAGGYLTSSAELFDPVGNTWTEIAPMTRRRAVAAGAVLGDGRVVVVGGTDSSQETQTQYVWDDADVYDPVAGTWTRTAPIPGGVGGPSVAVAPRNDGQVLAVGGAQWFSPTNVAALYNPATDSWAATSPMGPAARQGHIAIPIPGDRTLVAGGGDSSACEVFGAPNNPPVANAGSDVVVNGCVTCLGLTTLDASGSSDVDGDKLTYTWTEGTTLLARTTDPGTTVAAGLPLGTHTLTLTVTDGAGGSATDTVVVTVQDIVAGISASLSLCEADKAALESTLEAALSQIENDLRQEFRDPSFAIPGGSARARLQNLAAALVSLNRGQKMGLYRALGGQ